MARPAVKKRNLIQSVKQTASDVGYGLSELKRQAQGAAQTVQSGVKRIKQSIQK